MSNNPAMPVDPLRGDEGEESDAEKVKDPDLNADDVDSAEADRLAVEPDDKDDEEAEPPE